MEKLPKIFIVDDNVKNIQLLKNILRKIDCEVYAAVDGGKALKNIPKINPDLILLDIMMPDIDGFEVCEKLKSNEITLRIPIIFLSALNKAEEKNRAFELGAVDYISKPFNVLEILARIKTHLNNSLTFYKQNMLLKEVFHELYTPLSIINSGLELIKLKYKDSREITNIMAATKTLQHIYDDLYYSIKEKHYNYKKELLDLHDLLNSRINYFNIMAKAKNINFTIECQEEKSIIIMNLADLERIVDNTLTNALKYSYKNKTIKIKITKTKDNILLYVKNEGKIISNIKEVFYPYFQENKKSQGVGLGLSIIKHICDENGIDVSINSENGITSVQYSFKGNE